MIRSNYRYSLGRTSRKEYCPKCHRRTFKLYVDTDGNPLSPEVGRCDRLQNCAWHYPPHQFFADNPQFRQSLTTQKPVRVWRGSRQAPTSAPSVIDPRIVEATLTRGYAHNSLVRFLHRVFDPLVGAPAVDYVARQYMVGTSKKYGGSPVYWQIDRRGRVRTGKIMGYDELTGRRVKDPRPQFDWVHTAKSVVDSGDAPYRLQQVFFGEHLLNAIEFRCAEKRRISNAWGQRSHLRPVVALLESEKACLILALTLLWLGEPDLYLPMATGGCGNLRFDAECRRNPYHYIQALRGMDVVLFPDEGQLVKWSEVAESLEGFTRSVRASHVMEWDAVMPPAGIPIAAKGSGLDDVILSYIAGMSHERAAEEISALLLRI